jgi:multiple sugar transport system ATP-binding protein
VAIGRSIVRKPKVFLFDEPLSNLDAALRVDMRMEIGKLHKDLGATMIYVTHDQVEAMTLADKIVVLRAGEVMQVGTPLELYHNPANQFVAGFLGSPKMNFLDVEVKGASGDSITVASPALEPVAIPYAAGDITPQGRAILGVRPQFLNPGEHTDRGHLHGNVRLVERLGTETVLNVELKSGGNIVIALSGDNAFDLGSDILVGFEPQKAHLFPAA